MPSDTSNAQYDIIIVLRKSFNCPLNLFVTWTHIICFLPLIIPLIETHTIIETNKKYKFANCRLCDKVLIIFVFLFSHNSTRFTNEAVVWCCVKEPSRHHQRSLSGYSQTVSLWFKVYVEKHCGMLLNAALCASLWGYVRHKFQMKTSDLVNRFIVVISNISIPDLFPWQHAWGMCGWRSRFSLHKAGSLSQTLTSLSQWIREPAVKSHT